MGYVTAADTGYARLYDVTGAVQIVEKTFTNTTNDLIISTTFTLTAGSDHIYRVDVKAATGGGGSPFHAYGFRLVQR